MIATALLRASALAFVLATATACTTLSTTATADAPAPGTQPGFYRVWLGDFEVIALSDGTSPFQAVEWLTNTTPAKVKKALAKHYLKSPIEASFNAYLVNTGAKLLLIDAGSGALLGPTLGKLLINMEAAGYRPEQIDEIYVTHLHADHVGGIMSGDKLAFPNAIVRADANDAAYWLSDENLKKPPHSIRQ